MDSAGCLLIHSLYKLISLAFGCVCLAISDLGIELGNLNSQNTFACREQQNDRLPNFLLKNLLFYFPTNRANNMVIIVT